MHRYHCSFNPHPALRRGATTSFAGPLGAHYTFQSSPRTQAGCNPARMVQPKSGSRFNPHPALRRGATCGRYNRGIAIRVVSILTPHSGGVQRGRHWRPAVRRRCFNPHPALRRGATAREWLGWMSGFEVSILTPHSGGVQLLAWETVSVRRVPPFSMLRRACRGACRKTNARLPGRAFQLGTQTCKLNGPSHGVSATPPGGL